MSRDSVGIARHTGDALIWTWTAIANLGCEDGRPMLDAALSRLRDGGGYLTRYDPLTEADAPDAVTFDGEDAAWWGFAARARRCPEDKAELAAAWADHQQAVAAIGGRLHPSVEAKVPPTLGAVRDAVGAALGVGEGPSGAAVEAFGQAMAVWAGGVVASRAACYRVNLAWTAIRALEDAGGALTAGGRDNFCGATAGAGIATVEHWCGRDGLAEALDGWQPNAWEYRWQRCPGWESPDGGGLETPGLDLIVAMRALHGSSLDSN